MEEQQIFELSRTPRLKFGMFLKYFSTEEKRKFRGTPSYISKGHLNIKFDVIKLKSHMQDYDIIRLQENWIPGKHDTVNSYPA